jgi:fibronectin type 3 domain-containing protein
MSYILYRDGSFIGGNFGVANTTFVDTNLDPNITYSYNVSARDDSSNESARSNPVSATTFKLPDTTTPTVPTNLRLVSATASQLNFAWNSSTDDVAVTGYKVYRNDVYMMTVVTPAYYNAGLPSATSYNYQVSAVDAAGNESARTAALSATTLTITQTDKTAPTVPTGLRASLANATTVNLSWYAANDYASGGVAASGVAGYRIYRNNSWLANVSTTNYSDNTLVKSTNYVYQVISYDRAGNESAKSNAVQVATLGADRTKPNAPGYLKKKNSTSSSIEIGWNAATDPSGYLTPASGVVGYKIYRSGIYLATVGTLSYDDENLMPQTSFRYQVSALDGAGNESALSSVLTASTDLPPDTAAPTVPTNLRFSYDLYYHPTEARLYWSGSRDNRSGRLKYNIYRNDDFIASTTGTSYYQKLNDYGLYQYQIKAIDVTGNESAGSNMVAVNYLKDTTAPGAPANLIVKYNLYYYPKDVRLYWSHSHDDRPGRLKYNIYRNDDFIASTTNTSYFQKLTGYGSYQYQIKAVDKTGNESVGSNLVAIDYLPDTTAPITPAKFYVTQNSHDKSIVKISWYGVRDERPGAVKYNIYRNGDKIITIRSTYVYLRLPMKGSYQYQVTAVDVAGNESAKTAAVTIVW